MNTYIFTAPGTSISVSIKAEDESEAWNELERRIERARDEMGINVAGEAFELTSIY